MDEPKDPLKEVMSEYFRRLGAEGGKIGGKKRWEGKSDRQIKSAMKKVTEARLKKQAKDKKSPKR